MEKGKLMDSAGRSELVRKMRGIRVLVLGDLMLDQFIWGSVRRISPEAPVPVVEVEREDWFPGGAANVARNLAPFTPEVSVLGRVGKDAAGDQLASLLNASAVKTDLVLRSEGVSTILKTRVIARQQQVVRVDWERKEPLSGEETAVALQSLEAALPTLDAVILEDYGKGVLTQELVRGAARLCQEAGVLVTADPNPAHPLDWEGVSLVKPNRSEAFLAAGITDQHLPGPATSNPQLLEAGEILLEKWNVPAVLITLSEHGMLLFQRGKPAHHIPTRAREIFDVSGAGDTAIALLTLARAAGLSWEAAAEVANLASGVVIAKLGTASLTPEELIAGECLETL